MHVLRTFLTLLLVGVVPAQQSDVPIPPNFVGDDIEKIFKSAAAPKSEFETTAQYVARRSAESIINKQLVLLLDDMNEESLKYDADLGIMTTTIPIKQKLFILEPDHPTYQVLAVRKVKLQKDEYIGQNSFGAKTRIERLRSELYGVVVNQNFLFLKRLGKILKIIHAQICSNKI